MGTGNEAAGGGANLLELRIHGVLNTPAYEMLDTTAGQVRMVRGDQLAGFTTYSLPLPATAPTDRRVEAYAWGRLARYTGLPALGRIGDALIKVLWFALAPYGLANTAYWSRSQIGTGSSAPDDTTRGQHQWIAHTISTGRGAGTLRMYGLLLSLLFVTTAATVALDMMARQCFGTGPVGESAAVASTCPGARAALAPLSGWGPGARDALLLALPLVALAVVVVLPMLGRTRYLTGPSRPGRVPPDSASAVSEGAPLLAQRDIWLVGSGMGRLRRIHSGAALAWLAAIVAFDHADAAAGAGSGGAVAWPVATVLAVLLTLGGVLWITQPQAQVAGDRPRQHVAYLMACAVLLAVVMVLGVFDPSGARGSRSGALAATVLVLAIALTLAAVLIQAEAVARRADVQEAPGEPRTARETLGWKGRGPFVVGSLAAGFALLLSFAVVLGAGWVLGGPKPPLVYVLQGAGFLVLLVIAICWLALRQAGVHRRGRALRAGEVAAIRERLVEQAGHWTTAPMTTHAAEAVHRARRQAALLRRMEIFVGWIGWAVFVGICVGWCALVFMPQDTPTDAAGAWTVVRVLGDAGLWAGMIAVVLLYLVSRRSDARPLGLLWDLMCFLPTQGHPFGPSCYAERVVPELADRIVDWFAAGEAPEPPAEENGRGLVISAHSMGIVLAVGALFQLGARGLADTDRQRIGLLSYGCQLRRYFSRFFPGVCGPDVLSLVPSGPPSPTAHDPWPPTMDGELAQELDLEREQGGPGQAGSAAVVLPGSLGSVLGDRWLNLYRVTDPLGFPVRYVGGAAGMDRAAAPYREQAYQFLPATNGSYLESTAYARAFTDLRERLGSSGDARARD